MNKWKTIDTAPKDEHILLLTGEFMSDLDKPYTRTIVQGIWETKGIRNNCWSLSNYHCWVEDEVTKILAWMPLPELPVLKDD